MTSLAELGALYLDACALEGKSPNTLRAYRETVGLWDTKTRSVLRRPSVAVMETADDGLGDLCSAINRSVPNLT